MKRMMKTFGLVVATLILTSNVEQVQAGKKGGSSRSGGFSRSGGSSNRSFSNRSHSSNKHRSSHHRSSHHGSNLLKKYIGGHSSHHGHHNKHVGHHKHIGRYIFHNYLNNDRCKNFVHYYNAGRTRYLNPYCPAPVIAVERTPVPDGSTLSIHGKWFRSRGHAWMMIADRRFPIRILESTPGALTMQLPHMGVSQPTPARFFLVLPNGLIVEKNYIVLTPQPLAPAPVPVHP